MTKTTALALYDAALESANAEMAEVVARFPGALEAAEYGRLAEYQAAMVPARAAWDAKLAAAFNDYQEAI